MSEAGDASHCICACATKHAPLHPADGLRSSPAPVPARSPGWTLTSISGFSQAFARAVESAVVIRSSSGGAIGGGGGGGLGHRPPPTHLGTGLTQGLAGLAEGVAAGITGVVRSPMQASARASADLEGGGGGGTRVRGRAVARVCVGQLPCALPACL